jgi:L-threonylcarbamoyladenylate synthase
VAVPTETVYGLAGNALSEKAVRKIFNVKGRPLIDPLITHFKSASAAFAHVHGSDAAEALAAEFWPGPLTMVLAKTPIIPDLVTSGLRSAAVRVPSQPLMLALLKILDFPLAAPSANPFGYVSPTRPEHVAQTLGSKIAAILDGGPCLHGIESTVLDMRNPRAPRILRPGPICPAAIEAILGRKVDTPQDSQPEGAQISPGQLTKHYSPKTKIKIVANGQLHFSLQKGEAIIANRKPAITTQDHVYWLSEDGELEELARNFFDLIQKLDRMHYTCLTIEAAPDVGIGIAYNDRLRRAAAS